MNSSNTRANRTVNYTCAEGFTFVNARPADYEDALLLEDTHESELFRVARCDVFGMWVPELKACEGEKRKYDCDARLR